MSPLDLSTIAARFSSASPRTSRVPAVTQSHDRGRCLAAFFTAPPCTVTSTSVELDGAITILFGALGPCANRHACLAVHHLVGFYAMFLQCEFHFLRLLAFRHFFLPLNSQRCDARRNGRCPGFLFLSGLTCLSAPDLTVTQTVKSALCMHACTQCRRDTLSTGRIPIDMSRCKLRSPHFTVHS